MDDASLNSNQLEVFVNDILTEKNLPGLTDDARTDVVQELSQTLRELIDRAVIEALPEEKLDELNSLLDNPDTTKDQVATFVSGSGVDTEEVAKYTMLRFRELYLEGPGDDK